MSLRHVNLWLPKIQIKPTYWKNSKKKCHKIKRRRTTTATTKKKNICYYPTWQETKTYTGSRAKDVPFSAQVGRHLPEGRLCLRRMNWIEISWFLRDISNTPFSGLWTTTKKFCITIVSSLGKNQGSLAIILLNRQVTVHAVKTICWKKNE